MQLLCCRTEFRRCFQMQNVPCIFPAVPCLRLLIMYLLALIKSKSNKIQLNPPLPQNSVVEINGAKFWKVFHAVHAFGFWPERKQCVERVSFCFRAKSTTDAKLMFGHVEWFCMLSLWLVMTFTCFWKYPCKIDDHLGCHSIWSVLFNWFVMSFCGSWLTWHEVIGSWHLIPLQSNPPVPPPAHDVMSSVFLISFTKGPIYNVIYSLFYVNTNETTVCFHSLHTHSACSPKTGHYNPPPPFALLPTPLLVWVRPGQSATTWLTSV